VGYEPTILVFERAKTVHASDSADTVIGKSLNPAHLNFSVSELARSLTSFLIIISMMMIIIIFFFVKDCEPWTLFLSRRCENLHKSNSKDKGVPVHVRKTAVWTLWEKNLFVITGTELLLLG
jgi:hypothetical protein